ncbi:MAG: sodium-dependent transporter [Sediminispirochaetaceae bacterium]
MADSQLNEAKRGNFTSSIGFVLATAGSAVGLGNLWRFPYMTGTMGGGAFVLVYLLIMVVVGVSLLLVEFTVGRSGKANAVDSYRKISPKMVWIGYLGFFSAFIFLSYFSVVGGWTIHYVLSSLTGLFKLSPDEMGGFFGGFISNPIIPLIYHLIFMSATVYIIASGIEHGIEKWSKILMPALFVMMLILVVRSLTLPGAIAGVGWYLKPDFSKINLSVIVAALGQVFFSLSVGMSGMVTYASYLKRKDNLPKTALQVSLTDTAVALVAGFMIFPAIFAFGMEPGQGVGLMFITLPTLFSQMPLGAVFSFIFFILVFIAALTSSISILEMPVAYIIEKKNMARPKAAILVGGISFVLGIAVSFSFGIWGNFTVFGQNIFGLFDYFGSNISLPLGALGASIAVGWFWNKKGATDEITNGGELAQVSGVANTWYFLVKYIIPIFIFVIFLSSIGLLAF